MEDNTNKRIKTNLKIKNAPLCRNCPARLYQADDNVVTYGRGMFYPEYMFILPVEGIWSEQIDNYLNLICEDIIDINLQYITYHPKCVSNKFVDDYEHYCKPYLLHEIQKVNPKKIIFFGVDVPEQLLVDNLPFKIYKFRNIFNIYYGNNTIENFKHMLRQTL